MAKKVAKTAAKKAAGSKVKAKAPAVKKAPSVKKDAKKKEGKPVKGDTGAGRAPKVKENTHHSKSFLEKQLVRLVELRDHILDQMQGVSQDSLRVRAEGSEASAFGMHQADAGSDAYDKDFALSLLSQEQDALYEINEALKRMELGTYGVCEMSGKSIPKARLEAIPYARFTIECQSQIERENKGRKRWDTHPQFMDSSENLNEEDDEGTEEDERRKEKGE